MFAPPPPLPLIGVHCSIAGGVYRALLQGQELGANTIQLFTSNQRQWKGHPIDAGDAAHFRELSQKLSISHMMSHANYLINLGSPSRSLLEKSRYALREEVERCLLLGLSYLNIHPGVATGGSEEECLSSICESLLHVKDLLQGEQLRILLETSAGQGRAVGSQFNHLATIIERVKDAIPIGVCIDTCHIFAAGYEVRSAEGWKETLQEFDALIGMEHLYAFHVNDSVYDKGERKDRHANIGQGKIGQESFRFLLSYPPTASLPKYLETPASQGLWKEEISLLRHFATSPYP